MAISVVQKVGATCSSATSLSCTLTGVSSSNYLLFVFARDVPINVGPSGFTLLYAPTPPGSGQCLDFYGKASPTAGSNTVTVTFTGTAYASGTLMEIAGLGTSPLDITAFTNGSTTDASSVASGTLNQASEIVVAAVTYAEPSGTTNNALTDPPTGFTSAYVTNNTNNFQAIEACYQIVLATTSVTASWTWTATPITDSQSAIIGLKAAVAGTIALTGLSGTFAKGQPAVGKAVALSHDNATFAGGTLLPARTVALTGVSATFALGTLVSSEAVALAGVNATFAPGAMVSGGSTGIAGVNATFALGVLGLSETVVLTPVNGTFATGVLSESASETFTLTGVNSSFVSGAFAMNATFATTGLNSTFATGAFTSSEMASFALIGANGVFAGGVLTSSQMETLSLAGVNASFATGALVPSEAEIYPLTGVSAGFTEGAMTPGVFYFSIMDANVLEAVGVGARFVLGGQ